MIKIEDIAFWFWFVSGLKTFLVFLFFQSNPLLGTFSGLLLSLFFFSFLMTMKMGNVDLFLRKLTVTGELIFIFIAWSLISIGWTQTDSVLSAFGYCVSIMLDLFIVLMLISARNVHLVATKSMRGISLGALVLSLVALSVGGYDEGSYRLGHPDFLPPNTIGNSAAIGALVSIYLLLTTKGIKSSICWLIVTLVILVALLSSISKTAIVSFAIALLVLLFGMKSGEIKKIYIVLLMIALIGSFFELLSSYAFQYLYETQGGDALTTVSGRTNIWIHTWEMIKAKIFIGYGFLSFRNVGPQVAGIHLYHAHNELLQVWFSLGIVGLLISIGLYIRFYLEMRKKHLPHALLGLSFLVYSLSRGIVDASVTSLVFALPLMLLMSVWVSARKNLNF